MSAWQSMSIMLVAGALALVAMVVGWRHRVGRTSALVPDLPALPVDGPGSPTTAPIDAMYVSTTVSGDWLDSVAAHRLAVRGNAVVQVFEGGVLIERQGTRDLFLPRERLRDAGSSDGMAGKFVGRQGLTVLTWQGLGTGDSPGALLDTGLRTRHAADRSTLVGAVHTLIEKDGQPAHRVPRGEKS